MKEKKEWSEVDLIDFNERWHAITIPVNTQIEITQNALDLERTNQIIMEAEKIALGDCRCRTTLQKCNFPRHTCIFLNNRAETQVKNGQANYVTSEQAKLTVSETHKVGLVHLALYQLNIPNQFPSEICSCCPCCCQALQGLQRLNMKGLVDPSEYVSTSDSETCTQCGVCIERCHFGARVSDANGKLIYRHDLCFGCGLCVSTCPESAIKLIPRDSRIK
ncbi:MAG: ATP-binding protein [Candidatus Hermodarchaeota archaeon]